MKRSIESSTSSCKKQKKPFRISKCVMQNKIQNGKPYGEDIKPIVAYTDDACVIIVADGHGGRDAVDCILKNKHEIIQDAFESAEQGLHRAIRVCENAKGGAMVSVVKMENDVEIASIGDCTVCVYSGSKLIHTQPKHNIEWFLSHKEEAENLGITAKVPMWNGILRPRQPTINEHGVWESAYYEGEMHGKTPERHPEAYAWYFHYENGSSFATCAGAGHMTTEKLKSMKPIVCKLETPNCRVVCGSDGLGDVIHPKESIMHSMNANILAKMAHHRWTSPSVSTWGTYSFRSADDISVAVVQKN